MTLRWLRVVLLLPLAATILMLTPSSPASAASKPVTDWSFYVLTTNTSTMYQLGCNQVQYDETNNYNSFVILDFGALVDDSGDQELINGTVISPSEVWTLSAWFAAGYSNCRSSSGTWVSLAVGTNNSNPLDYNKGVAFANTVNSVAAWDNTYEFHVATWGAIDIESWSTYSITPTQSYNWYSGYSAAGGPSYVDYGSLDGCPTAGFGPYCSYGWQQGDYYNFSWREPNAWAVPEIYYLANAEQWYWTSEYGSGTAGVIQAWAPLDEYDLNSGTLTPQGAWNDYTYFQCPAGACSYLYFSMEIHQT